ncbi:hypothetical protein DMN91_008721 [Ooceraea biroi]|uniref:Uncharacterized protein n=1 Tax=Ooceraea biroi TaxID=2015173 RepID=A0A3L8DDA0_OOCBI|nr:hypothetical protein DMN91_008721 [Ooceraea biroi]
MYQIKAPLEQMDNAAPSSEANGSSMKKRRRVWGDLAAMSNVDVRRMRLLSRSYNLTRTGYKYLEIGIGVPPTLDTVTVHVAMGDTTGKKILLNAEMWKGLVNSRAIVCDYLARANGEHVIVPPPM